METLMDKVHLVILIIEHTKDNGKMDFYQAMVFLHGQMGTNFKDNI
jgi:hypothetical protein